MIKTESDNKGEPMKKIMTKSIFTFTALLFIASGSVLAQESDYQVQQQFRAEYNEIIQRIDTVSTAEGAAEINDQISELEADYSGYSDLLNSALYPETFEESMSSLQNRLVGAEDNISVVDELNEQITELENEISGLRTEIDQMNQDAETLRNRIERSSENEERLSSLVSQYRQNIENRDQFVMNFLDNLLRRYQAMDSETESEIANAAENLEDNPLELLRTIISEYINQADRESGLEAPDYIRMRAQHGYFESIWEQVGERLANVYSPDSPVQAQQEITDLLAAWQASVDNKLWNALSTAFNQNGIELPEFTSADAFFNALNTFVDNGIETASEQNEEADLRLYSSFNDFWNNTVKAEWGEPLMEAEILTQEQIATIDNKLGEWSQEAEPVSNLMFILFLISLAVIIGLIVLLVTKKS